MNRKKFDILTGVLLMIASVGGFVYSNGLRGDAGTLPRIIFVALLLCGAGLIAVTLMDKRPLEEEDKDDKKKLILVTASILGYIILMNFVGFYLATAVYLIGTMYLFGVKNWKVLIGTTLCFDIIIYFAFEKLLYIQLPAPFFL